MIATTEFKLTASRNFSSLHLQKTTWKDQILALIKNRLEESNVPYSTSNSSRMRWTRVSTAKSPGEAQRYSAMKNKGSFNNCFRVRSIKINNQSKVITSDFDSTFQKNKIKKARVRTSKARRRTNRLSFDSKRILNKDEVKDNEDNVSWMHHDGLNDNFKVGIVIGNDKSQSPQSIKQGNSNKNQRIYFDANKIQNLNEYSNLIDKDDETMMFNNFEFTSEVYLSKSKETRTSLVQINKGKVIQNNTKEFTESMHKIVDKDICIQNQNKEFGDTYFKKLGEKLQLQYPDLQNSDGNYLENFRNTFVTPKSTLFCNTFDNANDAKPVIQMIHSKEMRKLSSSQVIIKGANTRSLFC